MLAADRNAVICDLAETYGILDYKALPVPLLATLCSGLRETSRIKLRLSGMSVPSDVMLLAAAVCIFGIYAFAKNNIADYLFQRSQFVFFDMEQPLALFFAEYLAMMGLWVCLAYYLSRALQRLSIGKEGKGKA